MGRRAKPEKANVKDKRPLARTSPKDDAARVRDLEKRLAESLEREKAAGEILRVISSSPTDLQPVLAAIAESATRLCASYDANIFRLDGDVLRLVAHHGPLVVPLGHVVSATRGSVTGRAVLDRQTVQAADLQTEVDEFPDSSPTAQKFGYRTTLGVPLLREGKAIGAISLRRTEVQPFTEKQIALLQTFADQAVIAIENVRLFKELEARNRDLTATSQILQVISSSPTDAQPVFATIVDSAHQLFRAVGAGVIRYDGDVLYEAALRYDSPGIKDAVSRLFPVRPSARTAVGLCVLNRSAVNIGDLESPGAPAAVRDIAKAGGWRSTLAVPMFRDEHIVGVIFVTRGEPGAFGDREIELLKTFADQAVIAIENVRLFTELQDKNQAVTRAHAQVSEALEQQTATGEILRVISSSPTDVQPVFDAIVASATRLCEADLSGLYRFDGTLIHFSAQHGRTPGEIEAARQAFPQPLGRASVSARAILDATVVQVPDVREDPEMAGSLRALFRTVMAVPMLRDRRPIGAITVARRVVRPFADKQIALLQTFADQAVIAIENVRLFGELQARTAELTRSVEQLTALRDVGHAVSSSLDLETVLNTIVARAVQLAGATSGTIWEYDATSEEFVLRITQNVEDPELLDRRTAHVRRGEGAVGRLALTGAPVQIPDITMSGAYEGRLREGLVAAGTRALLAIPLLHEDRLIGGLVMSRRTPGEFSQEAVELLIAFATQSALAIQNARLFLEIEDKSHQLEVASQHKSEFLANMSHELRTPLNAILGFSEVLAEGMFGEVNDKQAEYLRDILESGRHLLSLINDILDLSKIEAGRMEVEPTDFDLRTAIDNALTLVRERAGRHGITLGREIDERVGVIRGDERKVKQVVLNLLSNAIKFTPEGGRIDVRAGVSDGVVQVSVADTGVGIAPEDQETVFEEFRQVGTADKKVEGTGLGLALSRKFIELHGGRIWVKSEVGQGSTFTFTIPVRHEAMEVVAKLRST
jgi:two-component system, NtrC family, sensor kinase